MTYRLKNLNGCLAGTCGVPLCTSLTDVAQNRPSASFTFMSGASFGPRRRTTSDLRRSSSSVEIRSSTRPGSRASSVRSKAPNTTNSVEGSGSFPSGIFKPRNATPSKLEQGIGCGALSSHCAGNTINDHNGLRAHTSVNRQFAHFPLGGSEQHLHQSRQPPSRPRQITRLASLASRGGEVLALRLSPQIPFKYIQSSLAEPDLLRCGNRFAVSPKLNAIDGVFYRPNDVLTNLNRLRHAVSAAAVHGQQQ